MMLHMTKLKRIVTCEILPQDYVYCEYGGTLSNNFIKEYLLHNDNLVSFSTYVRRELIDKIIKQLNYLVTKGKKVNKIKVGKCTKDIYSVLYFTLDFSELKDKIDNKIFIDIRGLKVVTIKNENDIDNKYLMGTIHMSSTKLVKYDLRSTEHLNILLLHNDQPSYYSIDDEDLARIIAFNIYSSLNKLKEAINDKKNLVEIDE